MKFNFVLRKACSQNSKIHKADFILVKLLLVNIVKDL